MTMPVCCRASLLKCTVAQLQHPNIVGAMDSGKCRGPNADLPLLHYFVMEYVPGQDLEACVNNDGPMAIGKACDLIHQVASALVEANRHQLVHRDIKPSNIRVTPEGQAKLLDFGLARHVSHRMTEPGTVLGTLDFMRRNKRRTPEPWTFARTFLALAARFSGA